LISREIDIAAADMTLNPPFSLLFLPSFFFSLLSSLPPSLLPTLLLVRLTRALILFGKMENPSFILTFIQM